ncbi:MAG: hypothetical protein H6806_07850 [Planctomycetes bacterium]|nr:hypothetical protein [Planctomycetota bacterium]MCB9900145.1 hypothetical protein [Planctomycetota bacterium]
MRRGFAHLEILGPRASAEHWLLAVQEAGVAHVADALHGLEGRPGIGRPAPTEWERAGAAERAEALRSLRALERVLPPSRTPEGAERPSWIVGFDGGDAPEAISALTAEAHALAARLGERLVVLEAATALADRAEARRAALALLASDEDGRAAGAVLHLPDGSHLGRQLLRALRSGGLEARTASPKRGVVVSVKGSGADDDTPAPAVLQAAEAHGAEVVPWPGPWAGRRADALASEAQATLAAAEAEEAEARAALAREVADAGTRARLLLDGLADAEARDAVMGRLAATEHVAALRVFVPVGEEARLREALKRRHGNDLVVRRLGAADDAPSHARRLAMRPFEALAGWRPSRLGSLPLPVLLAPVMPPALAFAWGDLGLGLVFLGVGALLGIGAQPLSPRRDTALLAQLAGIAGLAGGICLESAFGAAGERAFGTGWGLLRGLVPDAVMGLAGAPWRVAIAVVVILVAAAAVAATAAIAAAWRGAPGRGRSPALTATTALAGVGLALGFVPGGSPLVGFLLAAIAAAVVVAVHGVGTLFERTGLDLVGVVRLVAVGVFGVAGMSALLASTGAAAVLMAIVGLPFLALAVVADAGYAALGVPYDLALGGQRFAHAYVPFARRRASTEEAT